MKTSLLFLLKIKNLLIELFYPTLYMGQYTTNRNYGDALNIVLVKELLRGSKLKIIPRRYCFDFLYKKRLNLQLIGSVLGDSDRNSIIWGAGAISKETRLSEAPYKILAVRGPLTRALILNQGIDCPEIYGDPALLMPRYYSSKKEITRKVGIIPHYEDQHKPSYTKLLNHTNACFIDILVSRTLLKPSIVDEWTQLIDQICECEVIFSSSLHGLIIADAYKKPTVWLKFGDEVLGDDFKFYDYYASLGISSNQIAPIDMRIKAYSIDELIEKATLKPVHNINMDLFLSQNPWI